MKPKQSRLIARQSPRQNQHQNQYQNQLSKRFDDDFFSKIPRTPGVYKMYNDKGLLLYVGKSKCLRARLLSYRRARPGEVSRKVLRLVRLVRRIDWETCETDTAATLRENALLRSHKPPFNIVNTRPELYYFVGLDQIGGQLRVQLTTRPSGKVGTFFGAFRGRHRTRDAFGALLRLLWLSHAGMRSGKRRFEYPATLCRPRPPAEYHLILSGDFTWEEQNRWGGALRGFLAGQSPELLGKLMERLLFCSVLPKAYYHRVQEDLDLLSEFYKLGPARNQKLLSLDGRSREAIPQDELDDLLTIHKDIIFKNNV